MKPSGDFVVMEAKELVKLFDADGNAKKGSVLQPIPVNPSHVRAQNLGTLSEREGLSTVERYSRLERFEKLKFVRRK